MFTYSIKILKHVKKTPGQLCYPAFGKTGFFECGKTDKSHKSLNIGQL